MTANIGADGESRRRAFSSHSGDISTISPPIHNWVASHQERLGHEEGKKNKKDSFLLLIQFLLHTETNSLGLKCPKVEFLHFWVLVSGAKATSADDCLLGYLLQERNQLFQDEMGEGGGKYFPRSLPCPVTISWKSVSQKSRADNGTTTSAGGHICGFLRLG